MTARRALLAGLVVAALGALMAASFGGDAGTAVPQPPLTNEDVVRMIASGAPEAEIIDAIRTRPEAFDLADDMVDELGRAGVSPSILGAMRRRQAESRPTPPPSERLARGRSHLIVALNAGGSGPKTLRAPAWADEDVKARLKLPKETAQREVKDLAVFLACSTSEHVPDLWRSKSPLGGDMVSVMRHEMLAFVAGDTPAGKKPQLTLPDRIEADVDDDTPHDLVLGVAARIGDRWLQIAAASLSKVTVGAGSKPVSGRITRAGGNLEFKVELTVPR